MALASSSMRRIFRTKNFRRAYCSIFLQRHSLTVPLPMLDTSFLSARTKTTITVAVVDRFYWNFAVCLQFDVALLVQTFVKIRHHLPELLKSTQGLLFFRTQCSYLFTYLLTLFLCFIVHIGTFYMRYDASRNSYWLLISNDNFFR